MRRPALTGLLIAAAALAAAPIAAAQDASPFRDYTSPAADEYGHPPCNEQGNGQGDPNGNCNGHQKDHGNGNGNGNGNGGTIQVKGARASSGGRSAGGGHGASGSAPATVQRPVLVRAATASSAAARPSGGLPFTGRDLTLFVVLAVAALGAGALLAAADRVTRSRRPRRAR
jgi:hypothetical protein